MDYLQAVQWVLLLALLLTPLALARLFHVCGRDGRWAASQHAPFLQLHNLMWGWISYCLRHPDPRHGSIGMDRTSARGTLRSGSCWPVPVASSSPMPNWQLSLRSSYFFGSCSRAHEPRCAAPGSAVGSRRAWITVADRPRHSARTQPWRNGRWGCCDLPRSSHPDEALG